MDNKGAQQSEGVAPSPPPGHSTITNNAAPLDPTVTADDPLDTSAASRRRRRRSTFYVPLNGTSDHLGATTTTTSTFPLGDSADDSLDLSACSLDDSVSSDALATEEDYKQVLLGGEEESQELPGEGTPNSSTPLKASIGKCRSRTNILNLPERISLSPAASPLKEKSKTLPQNMNNSLGPAMPSKNSFLLKSSPKIYGHSVITAASPSPPPPQVVWPLTAKSPRKSLSFIRRSHSTKVSRSSSRSFTSSFSSSSRTGGREPEEGELVAQQMVGLNAELLERLYKITVPADYEASLRRIFFKERTDEGFIGAPPPPVEGVDEAVHSGNKTSTRSPR